VQSLNALLQATLYWVSPAARAVLDALAECAGEFGSASFFAARLSFRDRHQLARVLAREALPSLEELAAWVRTLSWLLQWERSRTALCRLAIDAGVDPAACYRTVKRLTGVNWNAVRARGLPWLLGQLVDRCRARDCTAPTRVDQSGELISA